MGFDAKTADRVRKALGQTPGVAERRMVGGLSFLIHGRMCCGVTGTALMVRVGPLRRGRALARPHVRPMRLGGRPLAGFVCVDPEGYGTERALAAWIREGIDFVEGFSRKQASAGERSRGKTMVEKKSRKPTPKVKSLRAKRLTSGQEKRVKGGGKTTKPRMPTAVE